MPFLTHLIFLVGGFYRPLGSFRGFKGFRSFKGESRLSAPLGLIS